MNESAANGGIGQGGGVAGGPHSEDSESGTVTQVLPNAMFRVALQGGREVTGHVTGDARALLTRLVPGDQVRVQLSPVDTGLCRIVGRPRNVRGR